jgi:hypothetical protein
VSSTQTEGGSKLKPRHGLSRVLMAGESADADEKAKDFIVNALPGLIEYIYNADETELIFKCMPDKRMVLATRNVTADIKVKIDLQ